MTENDEKGDGINREGLEFRVGWCEATAAILTQFQLVSVRCKKGEEAGLRLCHGIVLEIRKMMLAKMKGE